MHKAQMRMPMPRACWSLFAICSLSVLLGCTPAETMPPSLVYVFDECWPTVPNKSNDRLFRIIGIHQTRGIGKKIWSVRSDRCPGLSLDVDAPSQHLKSVLARADTKDRVPFDMVSIQGHGALIYSEGKLRLRVLSVDRVVEYRDNEIEQYYKDYSDVQLLQNKFLEQYRLVSGHQPIPSH